MNTLARIRKTLVAIAGIIGQAIAAGVLTGDSLRWAQIVLAALTALGVYVAPNRHPHPHPGPGV